MFSAPLFYFSQSVYTLNVDVLQGTATQRLVEKKNTQVLSCNYCLFLFWDEHYWLHFVDWENWVTPAHLLPTTEARERQTFDPTLIIISSDCFLKWKKHVALDWYLKNVLFRLQIPHFVNTNSAGDLRAPWILLFSATNASGKCPDHLLEISSICTFTDVPA